MIKMRTGTYDACTGTGERIVDARYQARMSQRELARRAGVNYTTAWRWEKNLQKPTVDMLERIARILGTTVAYLVGETDESRAPLPLPQPQPTPKGDDHPCGGKFDSRAATEFYQHVKDNAAYATNAELDLSLGAANMAIAELRRAKERQS